MRTNIVLDEDLVKEAFKYTKAKTKRELVHIALQEFIQQHKKLNLLELQGKISFDDEYDYKKLREGK